MYKVLTSLLFVCLVCLQQAGAQVLPKEGATLNYRIVGFQLDKSPVAAKYKIEIAAGTYNNEDSFVKNIMLTIPGERNRIIGEVPEFGKAYTWRSTASANGKPAKSELRHFSTLMIPEVDTHVTRLRIMENVRKNNSEYIFFDVTKTLYDMNGRAVWFLPFTKDTNDKKIREMLKRTPWGAVTFLDNGSRDMKCSPLGTITFLNGARGYEVNYNGDVLWTSPRSKLKDSLMAVIDNFNHHDLARLPNGHYMTLGVKVNNLELPPEVTKVHVGPRSEIKRDSVTGKLYQQLLTGRVIEYDQQGNVVWEWSAYDYLINSDLFIRRRANGAFKLTNTHENAFYFDEQESAVYVSFKNLNRIVKVQYPSGKVLNTFGTLYTPGDQELNNDMFCKQHNCRRSMDGLIYVYNNNTCNFPCDLPSIVMMQEPRNAGESLRKVWEYQCTLDSMDQKEKDKLKFGIGGSVFELPDRSILCCMGGNYSKTFIVNRDKKILWSALPEVWDVTTKKWTPLAAYRSVMISRKELESLVWNEPVGK